MLLPRMFGEDLFDDWMSFPMLNGMEDADRKLYGKHAPHVMQTDVHDNGDHYEIIIDLPGFKKDELNLNLENGYLTVSAAKGLDQDRTDKQGRVIRQERYAGAMQRSFFVGEDVTEADVSAKFEDGVLHLNVKKIEKPALPAKRTIAIEG